MNSKRPFGGWWLWLPVFATYFLGTGCFFGGPKLTPFEPQFRQLGIVTPFAFKSPGKEFEGVARLFADQLTRSLFDTKRLRVIDPRRLDTTLAELKLPVGVPLDAGMIAKACEKLNADNAVYGNILSVVKEENKTNTHVSVTLRVQAEATLAAAATTEVLARGRATGTAHGRYKTGQTPPIDLLINQALADASEKIAFQLVIGIPEPQK